MSVTTTKMSSKGQIVIPQNVRDHIQATEGTLFAVTSSKDSVLLKKIHTPSKETLIKDLKKIAKEGRKRAQKLGIRQRDIPELVHKARK